MRIYPHEKFEAIYWAEFDRKKWPSTLNLAPGRKVYEERIVRMKGKEYRIWDPFRSKLAVTILKKAETIPITPGSKVLYLGTATGTTASHVSDIIGPRGIVYGVDFAYRVMREFINNVCAFRSNIVPILADARIPKSYCMIVELVDCIYADLAQPRQAAIIADNADMFLKDNGWILLAIKARSIDVTKAPSEVYKAEMEVLQKRGFDIEQVLHLEPYDKDHAMVIGRYRLG